jgi:iron complex transport system substrate-binding protein
MCKAYYSENDFTNRKIISVIEMGSGFFDRRMKAIIVVIIVVLGALSVFGYVTSTSHANSSGPIKVTDSLGRTFVFQKPVTRIVSLDPSATATLYALGAIKDLVGGNPYDSYPPNQTVPNVGNAYTVDYSELLNLSPQVVLGYGSTMPSYGTYINNTLNIPFLLDNPESFSQIVNFTIMLGDLTGTSSNATVIVNWMTSSLNSISSSMSKINDEQTIFYYLSNYGGYWTAGNNTFIDQFFQIAHLRNIATGNGYYTISGEVVANASPDIILLDQYVPESAVQTAPFNETAAMTSTPQKVYTIFNDSFFNEPDFRVIYAIQWLINIVYPGISLYISPFPINLGYSPMPSA